MERAMKMAELVEKLTGDIQRRRRIDLATYVRAVLSALGHEWRSALTADTAQYTWLSTETDPEAIWQLDFNRVHTELRQYIQAKAQGVHEEAARAAIEEMIQRGDLVPRSQVKIEPRQSSYPRDKASKADKPPRADKPAQGTYANQKGTVIDVTGRTPPPDMTEGRIGLLARRCSCKQDEIWFQDDRGNRIQTFQVAKVMAAVQKYHPGRTRDSICLASLCSIKPSPADMLTCQDKRDPAHATFTSAAHTWDPKLKQEILKDPSFCRP